MKTLTATIIVALCGVTDAANFSGDPELVRTAESSRIRSAEYWTGSKLKDWKCPCPITWNENTLPSGTSTFTFSGGTAKSFSVRVGGTRTEAIKDCIPHEVDHMVRATIVGHAIPRWIDEGCAVLFESESSRKIARDVLLNQPMRYSAWNMIGAYEYPDDPEMLTALYSESPSIVEWMISMRGPREVLKAQIHSLDSDKKWDMYVGEPIGKSRQRYEQWFAAKYAQDKVPSPADESQLVVDVFIAGDFDCAPCKSFVEYARNTTKNRFFTYRLHKVSRQECQRSGMAVPAFFINGKEINTEVRRWEDVDAWAVNVITANSQVRQPAPVSDNQVRQPAPVSDNQVRQPAPASEQLLPQQEEALVTPMPQQQIDLSQMQAFAEAMGGEAKPKEPDPEVDWSSIRVIVAISDTDQKIRKAVRGPSFRAFRRITNGKVDIVLISEDEESEKFSKYTKTLDVDIDLLHVSVLVPEEYEAFPDEFVMRKVELLLNATASNFSGTKIKDIPVEVIYQNLDKELYEDLWQLPGEEIKSVDSPILNIRETIAGILAALAVGYSVFSRRKPKKVTDAVLPKQ